jgi:hypothetical protein
MVMSHVMLFVLALLGGWQPNYTSREWAWFRAASTDKTWWITEGRGQVVLAQGRFDAELYDENKPTFLRLRLRGDVSGRDIKVRVRVEESDSPEFTLSGRLRRHCWPAGGGREVLLLSDGSETIGLFRELSANARCTPA